MADQIYKALPTEIGLSKIQHAMWTGTKLQLTNLVYGDGVLDVYTMHSRTELVNQLGMVPIDAATMDTESLITWVTAIIGSHLPNGTIREIGLVDSEGELCFIANTPEIDKVEIANGTLIDIPIEFGIKNTYSEYVEIPFDPSSVYATRTWVNANFSTRDLANITEAGKNVIREYGQGPIFYEVYEYRAEFELPEGYDPENPPVDPDAPVVEEVIEYADWVDIGEQESDSAE